MPPGSQNITFDGGCDYPPVIPAIDDSSSFLPLLHPPIDWKFHENIDRVCRLTIILPARSLVHKDMQEMFVEAMNE